MPYSFYFLIKSFYIVAIYIIKFWLVLCLYIYIKKG